jgi:putative peptidoglycan lipid II flippase
VSRAGTEGEASTGEPIGGPPTGGLSLRTLGASAAVLTVASVVGQLFGLGRELFVAGRVGTSRELDALLIALVLPTLVAATIGAGTTVALLPARAAVEDRLGRRAARVFVSGVLTWVSLASAVAMLAVIALSDVWISLIGPGLDPADRVTAGRFAPILAPVTVFAVVTAMLSSVCQIEERFRPIALAWLAGPVVSFVLTVALYETMGLAAFALGITGSFVVPAVLLLVYVIRAGLLPMPALRIPRPELAGFGRHALPLTLSGIVNQLKIVADRAVASLLPAGSISALRYGETLVLSPTQAIAPGWSLVVYPALVRSTSAAEPESLGSSVQLAIRYIISLLTPIAVATVALAPLVVDMVYRRGAFDEGAAVSTAAVVAALGPMFVLTMIQGVLVPAHNARRRGTFLLLVGVGGAITNLALNIMLGLPLGVGGIGLSTSLTLFGLVVVMAWHLRREEQGFRLRPLANTAIRAMLAAAIPAVPIGLLVWRIGGLGNVLLDALALAVLSVVGGACYVVLAGRLGLHEPAEIAGASLSAIRRRLRG